MGVRDTQVTVEAIVQPDSPAGRPTQLAIEALVEPDDANVSITQTAVEVLLQELASLIGETTAIEVGSDDLVLTTPSNSLPGHILIAQIGFRGGSSRTVTPPDGWNLKARVDNGTDVGAAVYWKLVGEGEPETHTFTFDQATESGGGISTYPDLNPANPFEGVSTATADGTSVEAPSIAVSQKVPRVIFVAAGNESASEGNEWTAPDGFSETRDRSSTNGAAGDRITVHKADKPNAGSGTTGLVNAAAQSGNKKVAILLALRDASASGMASSIFIQ